MKKNQFRFASVSALVTTAAALNAGPWEPLFNGKDLTGWKQLNGTAPYTVVGDAVVGTATAGSPNSFLATEKTFGDFIVEMEIKQEGRANGGIQFRSLSKAEFNNGRVHGYQFEIDPSDRAWTGGIYDEARRGWLYPGTLNPAGQKLYKYGEWNRVRIEAIGDSLRTWVNDQPVAHVIDNVTPRGFIALQVHSIQQPNEVGHRTLWRNIRIQTTDLTPSPATPGVYIRNAIPNGLSAAEKAQGWQLAWDGKTGKGWHGAYKKTFPTEGWAMKDGEIVLPDTGGAESKGAGDIVSDAEYSAFELQLEFKVPPGGNSGIKYFVDESIKPISSSGGGSAVGLEFQILDDERHPDAQKGTDGNRTIGSLYDLITKKKLPGGLAIMPRVDEWQHARIVVQPDGHVEHWLNGIKVVDYNRFSPEFRALVAKSKYSVVPNFALAPKGRILLQEHGNAVRFRSIKIRPLN
jgi:Domain of Unknown Function (DUF1080)